MPLLGLGTYKMTTGADVETVRKAIVEDGYRHIDTASIYGNEAQLGAILADVFKTSPIKREDLFIVTKIWGDEKDDVVGALKRSLQRLQLSYVDLYLVHFPIAVKKDESGVYHPARIPTHVVWSGMEECVKAGLARSIGVSNFNFQLLNDLLCYAKVRPVCNQIELNPYLTQQAFCDWMLSQKIVPVAYCPLGRPGDANSPSSNLINEPAVLEVAEAHNATPAQVLIAWALANGYGVIPKTSKPERSLENFRSAHLKLTEEEVKRLSALNRNLRIVDPEVRTIVLKVPMYS